MKFKDFYKLTIKVRQHTELLKEKDHHRQTTTDTYFNELDVVMAELRTTRDYVGRIVITVNI